MSSEFEGESEIYQFSLSFYRQGKNTTVSWVIVKCLVVSVCIQVFILKLMLVLRELCW